MYKKCSCVQFSKICLNIKFLKILKMKTSTFFGQHWVCTNGKQSNKFRYVALLCICKVDDDVHGDVSEIWNLWILDVTG